MNASKRRGGSSSYNYSNRVRFKKLRAETACVSSGVVLADEDFLLALGPFSVLHGWHHCWHCCTVCA